MRGRGRRPRFDGMSSHPKTTAITLAAVVAAGFPAAAAAKFDLNPTPPPAPAPVSAPPAVAQSSSPTFQWDDAGIGAAGVLAVFGVAGGSVVVLRQRRRQSATG
jgi:hypothetical protein